MGRRELRPSRRKAQLWANLFTFFVCLIAIAPAIAVAKTFYPPAWWAVVVIVPAFFGSAWWVMRHSRRADEAEAAQAETRKLSIEEIANHQPTSPRPRRPVRRWRRACGRAVQRIREGVS